MLENINLYFKRGMLLRNQIGLPFHPRHVRPTPQFFKKGGGLYKNVSNLSLINTEI